MDNAIPAHAIAEALRCPRHSHRGKSVPSLILRLEPLPEATARRDRERSQPPAPDEPDQPVQLLEPIQPEAANSSSDNGSAAAADQDGTEVAGSLADAVADATRIETLRPIFERRPQAQPPARRVVDVAAPERLTVATPLTRWSAAVAASHDACFVLDTNGILISISVAATELLGCGDSAVIGRHLLDVITLVDLDTGSADPDYATRITALAVLESPGLSRSLIRVRHEDNALVTLDTSSAPVHDVTGYPLGSVTFLAPIPRR